jgi:hypothetical protein
LEVESDGSSLLVLPPLLILAVLPFCLAFGQTGSDISPNIDDTGKTSIPASPVPIPDSTQGQKIQGTPFDEWYVPVPLEPDGSTNLISQEDLMSDYCKELKKEGVTEANLPSYCK